MNDIDKDICQERDWKWYCGPKPPEQGRDYLKRQGFRFSAKGHRMADGRVAHWYLKPNAKPACRPVIQLNHTDRIDVVGMLTQQTMNEDELDRILAMGTM